MKFRPIVPLFAIALLLPSLSFQGCYGRFGLTSKLYHWNGTVGDKWLNSIMMVAMVLVPVYGVSILADGFVLNTMEFWTGTNPVTLGPNETETGRISMGGKDFTITATHNSISMATADNKTDPVHIVFVPTENVWTMEFKGEKRTIAEQHGDVLTLLLPDGRREQLTR